jgi:hypothetical protein
MRHIFLTLVAAVISLALANPVQAQKGGGGHGGGGHGGGGHGGGVHGGTKGGTKGGGGHGNAGHGGTKGKSGKAHGHRQRQSNWGARCWIDRYGCWCYWSPDDQCYYYWCAPEGCYYPVSYCPTGRYNYDPPPGN